MIDLERNSDLLQKEKIYALSMMATCDAMNCNNNEHIIETLIVVKLFKLSFYDDYVFNKQKRKKNAK
jgi:hypothetical protein